MTLDLATGLLAAAMLQNLLVAIAVLWLRSGRRSDRWLAALLVVLATKVTPYMFGWRGHVEAADWLAFLPLNAPLAVGPLLFGYVTSRAGMEVRRPWLHLTPAAAEFTYCCMCLLLPSPAQHAWKEGGHDHWLKPASELAFVVSLAGYTVGSWRLARLLRLRAQAERSDADRTAAVLSPVTFALLLITSIGYSFIFVYGNFIAELDILPYYLWFAFLSMLIALEGWRATAVMSLPPQPPQPQPPPSPVLRRPHDWPALGARWRDRVDAGGWWREPDLTLAQVARKLGVNTTYLSRAINEGLDRNFNELINDMRAREVARNIAAGSDDELLKLALDAGFTSKATFNRAFRAAFDATPSAYRRGVRS